MTIALAGICFDDKSSFLKGSAEAPSFIRKVLHDGSSNFYAENGTNPFNHLVDEGDFQDLQYAQLEDIVTSLLKKHGRALIWGGDHSITYPIIKAYFSYYGALDIIQVDAHGDLYDEFEGDRHSHACPFARIMEEGLCRQLTQIGIRTLTPHQRSQVESWNVQCFEMKDIEITRLPSPVGPVYLSIDLDGFDPSYAPGVSHYEPGGLSPRFVIDWLHQLKVPIVGADIVEYNPSRDVNHMTAYLAAKLTKEVGAAMVSNSID